MAYVISAIVLLYCLAAGGQLCKHTYFLVDLPRATCDVWRVTCDVWRVTCDVWRVTCDVWCVTCDMMTCDVWCVTCDVWYVACDVWYMMCDVWYVACDVWRVICCVWRVTCDVWRVTCDVWRVTCDVWRVTCDVWRVTCDVWRVTCDAVSLLYRSCPCVCITAARDQQVEGGQDNSCRVVEQKATCSSKSGTGRGSATYSPVSFAPYWRVYSGRQVVLFALVVTRQLCTPHTLLFWRFFAETSLKLSCLFRLLSSVWSGILTERLLCPGFFRCLENSVRFEFLLYAAFETFRFLASHSIAQTMPSSSIMSCSFRRTSCRCVFALACCAISKFTCSSTQGFAWIFFFCVDRSDAIV